MVEKLVSGGSDPAKDPAQGGVWILGEKVSEPPLSRGDQIMFRRNQKGRNGWL
jgi:hypothetical protein